jgi:hypothetical protein
MLAFLLEFSPVEVAIAFVLGVAATAYIVKLHRDL